MIHDTVLFPSTLFLCPQFYIQTIAHLDQVCKHAVSKEVKPFPMSKTDDPALLTNVLTVQTAAAQLETF